MVDRHKDKITGLTPQEEQFCQFFVTLNNATHAYKQAYDTSGYTSEDAIKSNASKKLANTDVALRIEALRQPIAEEHQVTRDEIITRCLAIADEGARDRVPALRLISDMAGFNSKTVNVNHTQRPDISGLTPEQVRKWADDWKRKQGIEVIDVEPLAISGGDSSQTVGDSDEISNADSSPTP